MPTIRRITAWFGVDDDFIRPAGALNRSDWVLVAVFFALTALNRELNRPLGIFEVGVPIWVEYLAICTGVLPLAWRRRRPIVVAGYCFAHFFITCTLVPEVGYLIGYQAICFFACYSAAAWAADRRLALLLLGGIALALFGWLAWDAALGSGLDAMLEAMAELTDAETGILPPVTSAVVLNFLMNAIYIIGALLLGRNAWWQARNRALLEQQAATISGQSEELKRQAVVDERLRIARELHDVVAHHVSVMGIQAGAARTMLDRNPEQARAALSSIEDSSRTAVAEMRGLLGALRGAVGEDGADPRTPEPTLAELPALLSEFETEGFTVDLAIVEDRPGRLAELSLPLQLSVYRVISEALNNTRRHSTARSARVSLRGTEAWVEAEILDDGRPRPGSSGSGLGQLGMRERVTSHGGVAEIGPRSTGGYRVRVRLPLTRESVGVRHG